MTLNGNDVMLPGEGTLDVSPMLIGVNQNAVGIVCGLTLQLNSDAQSARAAVAVGILPMECRPAVAGRVESAGDASELIVGGPLADEHDRVVRAAHALQARHSRVG